MMHKNLKTNLIYLFVAYFALNTVSYSQLLEVPVARSISTKAAKVSAKGDTLHLPFWDDFSTAFKIDSSKWENSGNIHISSTLGYEPPTLSAAHFDGLDINGAPYSTNKTSNGLADALISKPLYMAQIPFHFTENVYLSFYYQIKGNGDGPDTNLGDSLRLQFKVNDSTWVSVWKADDGQDALEQFQQVILKVNEAYLYDGFQFRFQNFGNLSGGFDHWHVDYVYLHYKRSNSDLSYFDRALTTQPTSIFAPYSAIPITQFIAHPEQYLTNTYVRLYNLDHAPQPIGYNALIYDAERQNTVIDSMFVDDGTGFVINGLTDTLLSAPPVDASKLLNYYNSLTQKDSLYLITMYHLARSADTYLIDSIDDDNQDTTYFEQVDYRVNDTVRSVHVLHDYYAYDDGSAEFGAGVKQFGSQLAYQYVLEEPAWITHIQIHFPNFGDPAAPITLKVWDKLDSLDRHIIIEQNETSQAHQINTFGSYELYSPVQVADTFYIGFEQSVNERLLVGLDKNTDSGDRIYYNTDGQWVQNTGVQGSLLMRPQFKKNPVLHTQNSENIHEIKVFPNPTQSSCRLSGAPIQSVQIYSLTGMQLEAPIHHDQQDQLIEMDHLNAGIYLLKVTLKDGQIMHFKIHKI